jgi:predicted RNase H-like nuclease (RuvC/YqgF family)
MRRASAPATLARTTKKPPPPPPPATWALRRASKAAARQTADLAEALVVREVLAECIDDVAQAHHENEVNELKDLVDDQSLRLEVIAGERDAALRKIKQLEDERASIQQECIKARDAFCEDIVAWKRQQLQADEERARHERDAADARRVPSLERRIGELERDLQRASRRLELFSNAGKPAQNGHTEKRPPLTILEDRVVLRVFSFLVASIACFPSTRR